MVYSDVFSVFLFNTRPVSDDHTGTLLGWLPLTSRSMVNEISWKEWNQTASSASDLWCTNLIISVWSCMICTCLPFCDASTFTGHETPTSKQVQRPFDGCDQNIPNYAKMNWRLILSFWFVIYGPICTVPIQRLLHRGSMEEQNSTTQLEIQRPGTCRRLCRSTTGESKTVATQLFTVRHGAEFREKDGICVQEVHELGSSGAEVKGTFMCSKVAGVQVIALTFLH